MANGAPAGSGGGGTVKSVAMTATPTAIFDVTVTSPTKNPAIALSLDTQAANIVLAGPTTGSAATPSFRALVAADLATALASPPAIGGTTPAAITGTVITATTRLVSPILAPASDSTTAIQFMKADGSTNVATIDTTNSRVGIGVTPTVALDVAEQGQFATALANGVFLNFKLLNGINVVEGQIRHGSSNITEARGIAIRGYGVNTGVASVGFIGATNNDIAAVTGPVAFNVRFATDINLTGGAALVNRNAFTFTNFTTNLMTITAAGSVNIGSGAAASTTNATRVFVTTDVATNVGIEVRGFTSQSADLLQLRTVTPTTVVSVSSIGVLTVAPTDAVTAAVTNVAVLDHSSSDTPATGYGTGLAFKGQSSTTTSQDMGYINANWQTATHASRVGRVVIGAYNAGTGSDLVVISPTLGVTIKGISGALNGTLSILDQTNLKSMFFVTTSTEASINTLNTGFPLLLNTNSTERLRITDTGVTIVDAMNIVLGTSTGTKLGTAANQKLGLWGATPVAQHSSTGQTAGFTAGAGSAVDSAATFTGGVGSTAYTIGDIVKALKNSGAMAA